ncbi:uncharacterized protein LOC128745731 [Sabethes cyaneus]|uniref:uncharacterized protein LOC128745731 n=1 Tax=Sabethes cyaneus TaxID=53552 RepID=UPI00237EAB9D|nr:uncharacterized protein LOC128745731 [Sabethes cyaneus]
MPPRLSPRTLVLTEAPLHSLAGPSTAYGCNCSKAKNHRSHTHTTISSAVRKELASYENPHQHPPLPPLKVTLVKRDASTESLDILSERTKQECTCASYSPNSIEGQKCKKCNRDPKTACEAPRSQKKYHSSKYKDASTSPKSNSPLRTTLEPVQSPRSPKSPKSPRAEASTDTKFDFPNSSPKTENHYKRLSTLSINGAGSKSPSKQSHPSPKLSPNKLAPLDRNERVLEKSNSLGESKPQKLLRTTRSLSPRPPVKHQHSIMVSDENDIISVKLSPNEEFIENGNSNNPFREEETLSTDKEQEAPSETTSPNLSEYGCLKLEDGSLNSANNRSTSCLIYVPSDPWTRMTSNSFTGSSKTKELNAKRIENKYFSKPNLDYLEDSDPWVWRSNITLNERYVKKKGSLPHQTKSLSSAHSRDELDSTQKSRLCQQRSLTKFEKNLTIPGIDLHFDARKKITRPKLQRSKSPAFYEEFFQTEKDKSLSITSKSASSLKLEKNPSNSNINGAKCNCSEVNSLNRLNSTSNNFQSECEHIYKSTTSITSPTGKTHPSPKWSISQAPNSKQQPELVKASLTVLNPNLLQPRHSFSTVPSSSPKDDELQLNIRRLSEQMNKYNGTGSFLSQTQPPNYMNDTIPLERKKTGGSGGLLTATVVGTGSAADSRKRASSHSKINEPILETRC